MAYVFFIKITLLALSGMSLFAVLGWLGLGYRFFNPGADVITWADYRVEFLFNLLDPLYSLTENNLLLPIPLFTVTGYFLAYSKTAERVLRVSQRLVSVISGKGAFSIGLTALLVSALFTPLTGASGVTIIALGGLLLPVLKRSGYDENLSLGLITAAGSLGLLFFPSIPVILYGIISQNKAPVNDLYIAGILPGALLILMPALYLLYRMRGQKSEVVEPASVTDFIRLTLEIAIIPIIFTLFLTGRLTVTEIATVFFFYFLILEVFIFREIDLKSLGRLFNEALSLTGGIMLIIFFAMSFTNVLVFDRVPQHLFNFLQTVFESKYSFLIALNIFLLLVGAFMDIFSAIVVIAPLIIPVAEQYNINMIHLGVLFLTNLEIGYITPPVGINLFLSSFRFKKPILQVYRATLPFLLIMMAAQLLITYVPALSLWWQN